MLWRRDRFRRSPSFPLLSPSPFLPPVAGKGHQAIGRATWTVMLALPHALLAKDGR